VHERPKSQKGEEASVLNCAFHFACSHSHRVALMCQTETLRRL
jgi:hypothetical protein